ncbi:MAG TPA: GNAT family N-acetyltransferase [Rubricoccaceae bacterium]|jgi:hypothetical protein
MPDDVRHDPDARRFTLSTDAGAAVLAYEPRGTGVAFTHTVVPEAARGQGVGERLVRGALAEARTRGWAVVPECPFVADYLRGHPADQDLLAPGTAA